MVSGAAEPLSRTMPGLELPRSYKRHTGHVQLVSLRTSTQQQIYQAELKLVAKLTRSFQITENSATRHFHPLIQ